MKKTLTVLSVLAFSAIAYGQSTTTTSTNTTSAQVSEVAAKPSKWSAALFHGEYLMLQDQRNGNYDAGDGYSFIGADYKPKEGQRLRLFQSFLVNLTDSDPRKTREIAPYDFGIRFTQSKAFGTDMVSDTRLYLPTGEWALDVGKIEFRQTITQSYALASKTDLTLMGQGRLYQYTQQDDGQQGARAYYGATLTQELAKPISVYTGATRRYRFYNAGVELGFDGSESVRTNTFTDQAIITLGTSISPIDGLSIDFYADQYRNLRADDSFKLMNKEEVLYNLEFFLSI